MFNPCVGSVRLLDGNKNPVQSMRESSFIISWQKETPIPHFKPLTSLYPRQDLLVQGTKNSLLSLFKQLSQEELLLESQGGNLATS